MVHRSSWTMVTNVDANVDAESEMSTEKDPDDILAKCRQY